MKYLDSTRDNKTSNWGIYHYFVESLLTSESLGGKTGFDLTIPASTADSTHGAACVFWQC